MRYEAFLPCLFGRIVGACAVAVGIAFLQRVGKVGVLYRQQALEVLGCDAVVLVHYLQVLAQAVARHLHHRAASHLLLADTALDDAVQQGFHPLRYRGVAKRHVERAIGFQTYCPHHVDAVFVVAPYGVFQQCREALVAVTLIGAVQPQFVYQRVGGLAYVLGQQLLVFLLQGGTFHGGVLAGGEEGDGELRVGADVRYGHNTHLRPHQLLVVEEVVGDRLLYAVVLVVHDIHAVGVVAVLPGQRVVGMVGVGIGCRG